MSSKPIITREIAALPARSDDAHKGDVGRITIVGGCCGRVTMVGAPALAANAALRSGAGLVQLLVPDAIRTSVLVITPCATARALPASAEEILAVATEFDADVLAIGPGLGDSLDGAAVGALLTDFSGPVVVDADGLNLLAATPDVHALLPHRVVLTPHAGEAERLLRARNIDLTVNGTAASRKAAACALADAYGCCVVLKGRATIVTNGDRIFTNETGNSGMATAGTGDVLTGVIAALMGQNVEPFEAAILGVFLHGLAGDYAAEELGRWSVTATDVLDYLPEAFGEHEVVHAES